MERSTLSPDKPAGNENQPATMQQQPPARLYPDLPQPPVGADAPFPPQYPQLNHQSPFQRFEPNLGSMLNRGPTPFVPFGPRSHPTQGLNDLQHRMQPPRIMSQTERLQSNSFTDGLGKRLLSLVGFDIGAGVKNESTSGETEGDTDSTMRIRSEVDTSKALQNATVLEQLNRGIQSIYGSLSKMYNSTVQRQLNLLQEKFRNETSNSSTSNPWQQRMAQQVPVFFKQMAMRVEDAQMNLNKLLQQLTQANNSGVPPQPVVRQLSPEDVNSFLGGLPPEANNAYQPSSFFSQVGRSLGFGNSRDQMNTAGQRQDLASQIGNFWHDQVQPQLAMLQGQVARTWRDLIASGALASNPVMRSRQSTNSLTSSPGQNRSNELLDDILKSVDIESTEYQLLDGRPEQEGVNNSSTRQQGQQSNVAEQLQKRMTIMQREINQLWAGLTTSLQNALGNVRRSLNPGKPFDPLAAGNQPDPSENEIDRKIKDLSQLQQETDVVHNVVRQQQERAQQSPSFGDRFRNFFNNVDFGGVDQLPNRLGDSVARLGTVVGDIWNQIPERWNNLMHVQGLE